MFEKGEIKQLSTFEQIRERAQIGDGDLDNVEKTLTGEAPFANKLRDFIKHREDNPVKKFVPPSHDEF